MLDPRSDKPHSDGPGESESLDGSRARGLGDRVDAVVRIAAGQAAAVDREGRFPAEALAALKEQRLLGVMVPGRFGGDGMGIGPVVDICYRLGRACAATAMIYAMHQTKVACLVRHGIGNGWQEAFLRRLCAQQLLLASSTTEGQGGGNVRSSAAPIETDGDRIRLQRDATVMSYGAQADAVVTTARRSVDALPSDQVLVVFCKEDYTLELKGGWDTLGMRGTCSGGFALKATGQPDQVLATPYETIHAETMTPTAHLVWSGVWAGIAAAAVERAQLFTRKAARGAGGAMPPGALHVTRAAAALGQLRSVIATAVRRYEAALAEPAALAALDFQTAITLHKVDASDLAVSIVMSALRACGLGGYRNDGEASLSRHLRDVLSAPLMINNDRILSSLATAALLAPVPAALTL